MRIIKEGKIPEKALEKTYERTCENCGTIFEFFLTDIHLSGLVCARVACPLCGELLYVGGQVNIGKLIKGEVWE